MMVRRSINTFGLLVLFLVAFGGNIVTALFEDEVGLFDFKIQTTGHGPVKYVESAVIIGSTPEVTIITSDRGPSTIIDVNHQLSWIGDAATTSSKIPKGRSYGIVTSSCYVTSRSAMTGTIRWRRNVCSNDHNDSIHLTLMTKDSRQRIITMDVTSGTVRCWEIGTGSLFWDINLQYINSGEINNLPNRVAMAIKKQQPLTLWNTNDPKFVALNDFISFNIDTGDVSKSISGKFPSSSTTIQPYPKKTVACDDAHITISIPDGGAVANVDSTDSPQHELNVSYHNQIDNKNDATTTKLNNLVGTDTIESIHLLQCSATNGALVLVTSQKGMTASIRFNSGTSSEILWTTEEGLGQVSSALLLDASHTNDLLLVGGENASLADTDGGAGATQQSNSITRHHPALQFSRRVELQIQSISSSITTPSNNIDATSSSDRDYSFGMVKIALMLTAHKVIALHTSGGKQRRGTVRYQIDLPPVPHQHRIVHGSVNSQSGSHGINGGAHTREVLVVSYIPKSVTDGSSSNNQNTEQGTNHQIVQYTCFDGTNGIVMAKGSMELPLSSSKIIQIVPVASSSIDRPCRQDALLVLDDYSVVSVLDQSATSQVVQKYTNSSPHGFYTHVVDIETSRFMALLLSGSSSSAASATGTPVGSTSFPGERIVQIAYPNREEVVQSPCNVLGDESLLLKYLNPHMMVVVTVRDDNDDGSSTQQSSKDRELIASLLLTEGSGGKQQKGAAQKRKPLGVTTDRNTADASSTTGVSTVTTDSEPITKQVPNLFINVMDSVSGRIIYRVSHNNAVTSARPMSHVLISENWIFYTFVNERTRRTEVGVLSLYEGMIDPKGLTAFTSPQSVQSPTFSSLDARESKPVVLAKTYTIPKAITALGITSSRGGISARKLLLATVDGQIQSIDRKILETRRPVGPVKDSEKKEGLQQYNELIPLVSFTALSYNLTIDDVAMIASVPTDLESQTLIMAYGGCDIYIARISPSRGFDLLPESFNKFLLILVVVALFSIVVVTQRMGSEKILRHGWV
jgi:ER membrane protein complex subunit 1, C-terminal